MKRLPLLLLLLAPTAKAQPAHEVLNRENTARQRSLLQSGTPAEREHAAIVLGTEDLLSADEELTLARAVGARLTSATATAERALLLGLECRGLYRRNDVQAARVACDAALRLAREANQAATLAHTLRLVGSLRSKSGDPVGAVPVLRQALDVARAAELDDLQAAALNSLGAAAESIGAYSESAEYYASALEAAQRAAHVGLQAKIEVNRGLLQILTGDTNGALAALDSAHNLALRAGDAQMLLLSAAGLAEANLAAGRIDAARAAVRAHGDAHDDPSVDSNVRSRLMIVAARMALADRQFDIAAQLAARAAEAAVAFPFLQVGARAVQVQVLSATGRRAEALALLDELLPQARAFLELHHDLALAKAEQLALLGQWRAAFVVLQEEARNFSSAARARTLQQVAFIRDQREAEGRERELAALRERNAVTEAHAARDRTQRNVALAISALSLVVVVLLWIVWSQRNASRVRRELEAEVERRTQELSTQMERRRTLELQLDHKLRLESVGRLTGGVAHDFNNLMTIVQHAAELLRLRPAVAGDEAAIGLVAECTQAAQAGGAISRQLVAFARQQPLTPQRLDLAAFLEKSRALLVRAAGEGRVFEIRTMPGPIEVHADGGQLTAALVNLVTNARDFTAAGGHISIAARPVTLPGEAFAAGTLPAGRYAALEVSDDGRGMDAETLRRAIEPFYSTKELGAGAGLGLSMVHGFATQSGGDIAIDSQPGRGTRIVLLLPEVLASP